MGAVVGGFGRGLALVGGGSVVGVGSPIYSGIGGTTFIYSGIGAIVGDRIIGGVGTVVAGGVGNNLINPIGIGGVINFKICVINRGRLHKHTGIINTLCI